MIDDLVERLRANALDECDEAIDRIEELEAQLAEITAERDKFQEYLRLTHADWDKAVDRAETYRAATPVAYQMGLEAGAATIYKWSIAAAEEIEALTPPVDLVEQATQKVIDDNADDR